MRVNLCAWNPACHGKRLFFCFVWLPPCNLPFITLLDYYLCFEQFSAVPPIQVRCPALLVTVSALPPRPPLYHATHVVLTVIPRAFAPCHLRRRLITAELQSGVCSWARVGVLAFHVRSRVQCYYSQCTAASYLHVLLTPSSQSSRPHSHPCYLRRHLITARAAIGGLLTGLGYEFERSTPTLAGSLSTFEPTPCFCTGRNWVRAHILPGCPAAIGAAGRTGVSSVCSLFAFAVHVASTMNILFSIAPLSSAPPSIRATWLHPCSFFSLTWAIAR